MLNTTQPKNQYRLYKGIKSNCIKEEPGTNGPFLLLIVGTEGH